MFHFENNIQLTTHIFFQVIKCCLINLQVLNYEMQFDMVYSFTCITLNIHVLIDENACVYTNGKLISKPCVTKTKRTNNFDINSRFSITIQHLALYLQKTPDIHTFERASML